MTDETPITATPEPAAPVPASARRRRGLIAAAIAAPLALGALGLGTARSLTVNPTPVVPITINSLAPSEATAAKGEVVEIYGNKFVLQDPSGRALVETGRRGESGDLVRKGDTVTVQGRFDKGFLHAASIVRADGSRIDVKPLGGPRPGTMDWAKDKVGFGSQPDVAALTAAAERAGYGDVRVIGRGPRHLDVAAKNRDGLETRLHIGFDGDVREKGRRGHPG